jgi:hypothetical protein
LRVVVFLSPGGALCLRHLRDGHLLGDGSSAYPSDVTDAHLPTAYDGFSDGAEHVINVHQRKKLTPKVDT